MAQQSLIDSAPRFDSGIELQPEDHVRLHGQIERVRQVMSDGEFRTVTTLRHAIWQRFGVLDPEPSLSAQLRNLRKSKHGGYDVERKRVGNAYQFRMVR